MCEQVSQGAITEVCASNTERGSASTQKGEGVVMVFSLAFWPFFTRLLQYTMQLDLLLQLLFMVSR